MKCATIRILVGLPASVLCWYFKLVMAEREELSRPQNELGDKKQQR